MKVALPDEATDGFTLIEMIIAMMIMALAIVGIVGALTTMSTLTSEHRAHAVTEVGARSFAEAVQQQAQFTTKLNATVPAATWASVSAATLTVADTSLMPRVDGSSTYVSVDREIMRVTSIPSPTSIVVLRDVNQDYKGAGAFPSHVAGTSVVPVLACPTPTQLTPTPGTYDLSTGVTAKLTSVQTWNVETKQFEAPDVCSNSYTAATAPCPLMGETVLAECGSGFFRGQIDVTTLPEGKFRGVNTTTTILMRTGGPLPSPSASASGGP